MNKILIAAAVFALLTPAASSVAQEMRYISDQLYVPLRSGQGNQFRIVHKGLPSGTALKFIENSEDGEWSLVELRNGEQGWVRNQYLVDSPTAALQLKATQAELDKLKQNYTNLQNDYRELSGDKSSALNNVSSLTEQRDAMAQELAEIKQLSAGTIELNARYQELLERHQMLQTDADILKADNARLRKDRTHNQWIHGASILAVGMLFTLIIQGFSGRKRRSEWIN